MILIILKIISVTGMALTGMVITEMVYVVIDALRYD